MSRSPETLGEVIALPVAVFTAAALVVGAISVLKTTEFYEHNTTSTPAAIAEELKQDQ